LKKVASPVHSDFHKTFKPVVERPTVEWAEINRWVKPWRRSQEGSKRAVEAAENGPNKFMTASPVVDDWVAKGEPFLLPDRVSLSPLRLPQ